jgi:polar amino acid transport system substrate-binding protein
MKFPACFIISLLLFSSGTAYGQALVLNTFEIYPRSTPEGKGSDDLIIKEMFRRIGIEVTIVHLPAERALINANEGIDDGDFVRIAGLENRYPNLISVPEKITEYEFVAFSKDPSIRIRGWVSLKPYNVGIITGWKILEEKIVSTRSLTKVKDDTALFRLLEKDRADLVVCEHVQGNALLQTIGLTGVKALKPVLAKRDMFLYLNQRHAGLVPRLADALKKMKKDGTFKRIMNTYPRGKD